MAPTHEENQSFYDRMAALRDTIVDRQAANLMQNPQLAEALIRQIDEYLASVIDARAQETPPADSGLAQLIGLGPEAATELGVTYHPEGVQPYDETVTSERILGVADLYYIYQHEKIGLFRSVLKLQELFRAGSVRLSAGGGAYMLYQYDRKRVLRYTQRDRLQAYRRVFGYTSATPPAGAKPNREFHTLFTHFVTQVAQFHRDKRISEVIRERPTDPTFGSVAIVRRSGLDLRNNLKSASYGHVNVLRVEVLQLLDRAFRILGSSDIMKLFGADNAWDVVEDVMQRHLNQPHIRASQRNRMAIAGRDLLRWLAQAHILNSNRTEFEALLLQVADEAEEWITSAEALGIVRRGKSAAPVRSRITPPRTREMEWLGIG